MAYAAIRDYIKAQLLAVTNMGQVHDYLRLVNTWAKLEEYFTKNNRLNVWAIVRGDTRTAWQGGNILIKRHTIHLVGLYGLRDDAATEKTFLTLVDAVMEKFQEDHNLGDNCLTTDPPEVVDLGHRTVSNILCHRAVVRLQVYERSVV